MVRSHERYATTTASNQTAVGAESGQGSATQVDGITVVGYRSTSVVEDGVALGRNAAVAAGHTNSVAIGATTTTTGADQVHVGNRDVELGVSGKGLVLKSPDGTRYRVTVNNGGTLAVAAA